MITLEMLQQALDVFNRDFPRPGMDKVLLSLPFYDLQVDWPKQFPNAESPGVYFLFDDQQLLVYVGKASFSNLIGYRLGARVVYDEQRRARLVPRWEAAKVRYIATIALPAEHAFEAAAIEEYLVTTLEPCPVLNKIGSIRRSSQARPSCP